MNLVLGAFPPELGPWLENPPVGWKAFVIGIGGLEAGLSAQTLVQRNSCERVLFIGTCGSFDLEKYPLGSIVEVREAISKSLGEATGDSHRPSEEIIQWNQGWTLGGFPLVRAVCPPAMTHSETAARELSSFGEVEHLETASVFAACAHSKIPATACLAVSNAVGPEGHPQWEQQHHQVMQGLRSELLKRLV
jgi:nucleoside phosphorylase